MTKKRILLIDDEEDFCFFVKANLENTGDFEVTTATRGKEGIELAQKEKPDLILLDILVPEMPGDEVAEILLNNPETSKIPIVFLTAMVTKKEMGNEVIKEIGKQNFIAKPVTSEELADSINRVLKKKRIKGCY